MIDKFGRKINYARLSITTKCNFRCVYCMPEGSSCGDPQDTLSCSQITKLAKGLYDEGITKFKITGGEPLIRKDVIEIIEQIKKLGDDVEITLTTNGFLLEKYAKDLKRLGINGINISIDAVDNKIFHSITNVDGFDKVCKGIELSKQLGIDNIKLNFVPIKEINMDRLEEVIDFSVKYQLPLRFIELMPIGEGKKFTSIPNEAIKQCIENKYGKSSESSFKGNGPAEYLEVAGNKFGFISAINDKFCKTCNRIRVTSDGYLKSCLHFNKGIDLLPLLEKEASIEELKEKIREGIMQKPEAHEFDSQIDKKEFETVNMNAIGG